MPTIKAVDVTKYYKGNTVYSATFLDSQGNVLSYNNVTLSVNGKTYTKKTDNNGVVSVSFDLPIGKYNVVATNPENGYKLSTSYTVLPTISANNFKKVAEDNKKFTAKFLKSNGKALSKTYVKFEANGKTYKVKTDSKGKASILLKTLKKGTYDIVCYNTDGTTKTCKIEVYNKVSTKLYTNLYTILKNNKKTIKVKLLNGLGYAPNSGKIINIILNGKTYHEKTNTKGIAYFKLPSLKKGTYTIKYEYVGNAHLKASSASSKLSVISSKDSKLSVKSTTTFGQGANTEFKLSVKSDSIPVINEKVIFSVNKKSYTKTTNSKGIASLPIDLGIGSYTIKCSVKSDNLNKNSASYNIKVVKRTNTTLTWKSGSSFTEAPTFKVLLKTKNEKAISGETVKLTINSKKYFATTTSKGYATFKTNACFGRYDVSVEYSGSNKYIPSSTSSSVHISTNDLAKGINEKNSISNLTAYLQSSKNCEVGNSKIKSLVNSLTNGLTSEFDKANAIFNYVKNTIKYNFYYNTKFGSIETLNNKKGNCVDHTHLLVAMFRTAGIASQYVHGKCTFTSGNTYGHVWAQVLIDGTWVAADATSAKNSLGKISNWNTKTYKFKSKTTSLSF